MAKTNYVSASVALLAALLAASLLALGLPDVVFPQEVVENNKPQGGASDQQVGVQQATAEQVINVASIEHSSLPEARLRVDQTVPVPGTLYFSDTFSREPDANRSDWIPPWSDISRAAADRITTQTAIVRKGSHAAKFTVRDGDIAPLTYSENPRAQLNKNLLFCNGHERWIADSVYFPADFPVMPSYGWLVVNSFGFAPPFGNALFSFTELTVTSPGDDVEFRQKATGQRFWTAPIERGKWTDFVFHIKFSTNPSVGFVEVYKNGQIQRLSNGTTRMFAQTFDPDATACGNLQPTNYRKKGMFKTVTLYHDEIKVGSSYAAVTP